MSTDPLDSTPLLLQALQNPSVYDHPVQQFRVLETHISWVLLTGSYVYKIKKPVNLGFVDFSTLDRRRFFCGEELRLNQRLAPDLYKDLVAITGTQQSPELNGTGPVIEYAVKMKEFPQDALLSRVLERGDLHSSHISALAKQIADFHNRIEVAGADTSFGEPDSLNRPVMENFQHLPSQVYHLVAKERIDHLRHWAEQEHASRRVDFRERKNNGYIRECHGDLHLGNMALIDNAITIFDCIEFNERLRWIDVISELAFAVMDLIDRGHPGFASRLLNGYLENTGDYWGLNVLRYYQTYRAMVRAKVAGIRLIQAEEGDPKNTVIQKELESYIQLAEQLIQPLHPWLILTHGLSGSGKTTVTQSLLEALGAIRIRSDVERKRLFDLRPQVSTQAKLNEGMYTPEATNTTYEYLKKLTRKILEAGYPTIVDATFLHRQHRNTFQDLAQTLRIPFLILNVHAPEMELRARIAARAMENQDASDADLAVLTHQLRNQEELGKEELPFTLSVDSRFPLDLKASNEVLASNKEGKA